MTVVFRAGPPGVSHGHDDVLSLDATLGGVLCLVDPGISAYAPGPLTKLARSAGAHGMVLVDGQGPPRDLPAWAQQRRQDGRTALSFAPGEGCAVLGACRYGGESPASSVVVTRHVALSDARALSVHDTVSGQGIHRVTVCWQFAPGRLERVSQTGAVYVADAGTRVSLAVRTASHASPEVRHFHGDRKLPLGCVSLRGRDVPAPHMRYEVEVVLPFELRWEMAAQT